jgi:hypothetical protein
LGAWSTRSGQRHLGLLPALLPGRGGAGSLRACGRLAGVAGIRRGQQFGDWVTVGDARIGGGGNGVVWAVEAVDGRGGAIKVLTPRKGREGVYRLGRFKDEIGFLLMHPGFPGVLPLLDWHISDDLRGRSWYVMPVAVPIRRALGDDPEPGAVIAAVAEVAGTLETLAVEGVAHRDIKPDNLFELDGHWVIGDFGLVTYPDKDAVTEHGRKLGPTDYMAPEMRRDADLADPGPADVWALAKTLWVLLAGASLPLPGPHRAADPAFALAERISFTFGGALDLLLEKATQISPQARVSIAEMAAELRAYLAEPPELRESAGLEELSARAAGLTEAARRHQSDAQDRRARLEEAWAALSQVVTKTGPELGRKLNFDGRLGESGYAAGQLLGPVEFTPFLGDDAACLLFPPNQARPPVQVVVAVALRAQKDDGYAGIAALLRVDHIHWSDGQHDHHDIWKQHYPKVPIASAQQDRVIAEIRAGFINGYEQAMRLVISILSEAENANRASQ